MIRHRLRAIALAATALAAGAASAQNTPPAPPSSPTPTDAQSETAQETSPTTSPAIASTTVDPQERGEGDTLGDIVVTASRTESLASKTPVALTAISGEGLRDAGITQPINLVDRTPNLAVNRSRGGLNFTIRGVANTDTSEKGDSSTAFLLDGIYIARAAMRDASFFDVSRVEVLRGPQGTLYGRNTTAGVIGIVTNKPTFDFSGSADATAANFGTYQLTGAVNLPISDNIAIRAAGNYERNGSFLQGGPLVNRSYEKAREILAGRLSVLFKWESGELVLRGDYADIGGANFYSLPLSNFFAAPLGVGAPAPYTGADRSPSQLLALNITIPWDMYRNNNSWGGSVDLTQELGPLTVYYLGSYRALHRDEQFSGILANARNGTRNRTLEDDWQQSHELRVSLDSIDGLKLQAGAFYFEEESDVIQWLNTSINLTPDGVAGTNLFFDIRPSAAKSYAAFGQGTLSLASTLRVTGGLRYTHDEKSRRGFGNIVCQNNFFTCAPTAGQPQTELSNFASQKLTWKAGVDYDAAPGTLLYASVATGYKAGGFNNGCAIGTGPGCTVAPSILYFDPETLTAYEAGIKARFANNAVSINASVFHYDYDALQLTQALSPCPSTPNIPTSNCSFTRNAAKAKVDGIEIESILAPSAFDRVDVSFTYLDARYADFQIRPTINLREFPLNRAPRFTASAGYQHTFPIGGDGFELVAAARTRLSDSYVILFEGTVNAYRQPSFTSSDLTLTLNAPDRAWYLQGFAKNLENAIVFNDVTSGTFSSISVNDPRTYGVRTGIKF